MRTFKATGAFTVRAGSVRLSEEQADRCVKGGAVKPSKPRGTFAVLRPMDFKEGEVFGWDGDPGKGITSVEEVIAK